MYSVRYLAVLDGKVSRIEIPSTDHRGSIPPDTWNTRTWEQDTSSVEWMVLQDAIKQGSPHEVVLRLTRLVPNVPKLTVLYRRPHRHEFDPLREPLTRYTYEPTVYGPSLIMFTDVFPDIFTMDVR